jgi:integrase
VSIKRERIAEGIYKRVDTKGILTYYISYKDQFGKLIWEKVGKKSDGITPQYSKQLRSERIIQIKHGETIKPKIERPVTFDEIANDFIENSKLSYKDKRGSEQRYEDHIKPYIGHKALDTISKQDIEVIVKAMLSRGLTPGTVDRSRQTISAMFNLAKYNEKCKYNPASLDRNDTVSIMRRNKRNINNNRERFLTREEAKLLLDHLEKRSYRTYLMALIALLTGARAGEILSIQFKDIDYTHGFITLPETKNGTSRKINMVETIQKYLLAMPQGKPNDYIFQTEFKTKLLDVPDLFSRVANKLFNVGLDVADSKHRVVFHTLRHTFASWLAIDGVPIYTIKDLMGHKDITQTMRYAKLSPDIGTNAVRNLEKKLF